MRKQNPRYVSLLFFPKYICVKKYASYKKKQLIKEAEIL